MRRKFRFLSTKYNFRIHFVLSWSYAEQKYYLNHSMNTTVERTFLIVCVPFYQHDSVYYFISIKYHCGAATSPRIQVRYIIILNFIFKLSIMLVYTRRRRWTSIKNNERIYTELGARRELMFFGSYFAL